jgi:hypothetical protein
MFTGSSGHLFRYGFLHYTLFALFVAILILSLNYDIGKPHLELYSLVYKTYQFVNAGMIFTALVLVFCLGGKFIQSQSSEMYYAKINPSSCNSTTTDWFWGASACVIAIDNTIYWRWWVNGVFAGIMFLELIGLMVCVIFIGLRSEAYNTVVARDEKHRIEETINSETGVAGAVTEHWKNYVRGHVSNIDAVVGSHSTYKNEMKRQNIKVQDPK